MTCVDTYALEGEGIKREQWQDQKFTLIDAEYDVPTSYLL